jgi:hypothetical protein
MKVLSPALSRNDGNPKCHNHDPIMVQRFVQSIRGALDSENAIKQRIVARRTIGRFADVRKLLLPMHQCLREWSGAGFRIPKLKGDEMKMGASKSSVVMDCVRAKIVVFNGAGTPAKESDLGAWRRHELSPPLITASTRRRLSTQKAPSGHGPGDGIMQLVCARCARLDVHQKTVTVCVNNKTCAAGRPIWYAENTQVTLRL